MASLSKALIFLGMVMLGHAAYSAVQHRSFLRLAEEEYTGVPNDILLESLLGGLLCSLGVISLKGRFKDIKLTTELNSKSFETVGNTLGFMAFNHRGAVVYNAVTN